MNQAFNDASGCSIDASSHWFKELGNVLGIDFFDRSLAFIDGENIKSVSVFQLKKAVQEGIINENSLIFNNTAVQTIADMDNSWQIPAYNASLLKRFFNLATIQA